MLQLTAEPLECSKKSSKSGIFRTRNVRDFHEPPINTNVAVKSQEFVMRDGRLLGSDEFRFVRSI